MTPRTAPAAVVLAGGASRRMGRDKATLVFEGRTLVERVVDTVSARCDPVFVVAAPGQALPTVPAQILRDEVRGLGPLLATARGLRAAADAGAEWAFLCAVDMPHLTASFIDELLEPAATTPAAVVLVWDGRDHYLAGLYRTSLAGVADDLVAGGERSMRALVDAVDTQRIVTEPQRALTNVNTPDDLPV
ncbi:MULTISPECIES: molybdenum cofactor guanylyltransferase [Mycobacteriaceae]|uniref:Probable molybdenum cofactor guanylyltransferase n=1 Tax=Mycolicibacterium neoaurum VKM Ac-1815D TaxID=700508 RepID=V5XF02_MYCNE|nr:MULTISPECIES: molybdenum cofactor guanylyltransferase [Mycobacteriaceae]AHC26572.1 molybdopterin-guanine dinucleotide biosynthesis protein A [Mycolicibacterium neoaurum VKM Ac-1815D]AMO06898.1 molybdopterin-guanine dinucleotide biosynthesis protein A [Mycolicibacterium neoaurum]KJQ49135.1 molybdopterin-guanine dinucleotide biosynthesis protein A [Mycolicibacterium neoaurum]KUM08062.1 molybdopterin-guanine dinucleotide biosynthesis protein A [Mycolicibacterium neoaurum]MDO3398829.1 molybdenu